MLGKIGSSYRRVRDCEVVVLGHLLEPVNRIVDLFGIVSVVIDTPFKKDDFFGDGVKATAINHVMYGGTG